MLGNNTPLGNSPGGAFLVSMQSDSNHSASGLASVVDAVVAESAHGVISIRPFPFPTVDDRAKAGLVKWLHGDEVRKVAMPRDAAPLTKEEYDAIAAKFLSNLWACRFPSLPFDGKTVAARNGTVYVYLNMAQLTGPDDDATLAQTLVAALHEFAHYVRMSL